ncbi:aspartyl/asparaginyl beta-hydroxylase domain-containing protein [Pseudomonas vanderleydeniana]|uniref:Aspartyl/asparaginyl beta-hydroxylase domain-containing protein n=1 Tax=Pseudomonas vanderleydeniana TaxID=2745495 RepID=A0A9E6TV83_9PSED|nr:aspartyl/asparaginyl beta-hydroxylase domain-containing protein [Pseudomonas vanderleydeniana]QXI31361.1 aspartyl/asparaginyl beta-hydroxylase domain-containing protein [Pseudomonas vanderleydeniana]
MSQPAFSRLPLAVDLPQLLQALSRIPAQAWKAHFNTGYYEGDWSGVALISPADALSELAHGSGVAVARDPWLQDEAWARALDLPLSIRSARLLRLGSGGRIHEHRDYDLGAPDADRRLHIPLLSPPGVDFMLDGQRIPMKAGELWFLDLARPHSVDNWGEGERVHLVLDCLPEAWLEQQIVAGLATTPAAGVGRAAGDLARFRALLESEPALCEALQGLDDSEAFIARTLALASERGLRFGREDLRAAMRQGRNAWSRQWSF